MCDFGPVRSCVDVVNSFPTSNSIASLSGQNNGPDQVDLQTSNSDNTKKRLPPRSQRGTVAHIRREAWAGARAKKLGDGKKRFFSDAV